MQQSYNILCFILLCTLSSYCPGQTKDTRVNQQAQGLSSQAPSIDQEPSAAEQKPSAAEQDPGADQADLEDIFLPVGDAFQAQAFWRNGQLNIEWHIAEGYYLYKEKFDFRAITSGKAIPLEAKFLQGELKFDKYFNKDVEVFRNGTITQISTDELSGTILLKTRSQGCAEAGLCYAPHVQTFRINIEQQSSTMVGGARYATSNEQELNSTDEGQPLIDINLGTSRPLWLYLLMAFAGGLMLNFMPCVFPVLSLKAMGFAGKPRNMISQSIKGWAYTAGVVGSFLIAGIVLSGLRSAGESVNWGFQLQSPTFVSFIAYLFFVMGLSLSGLIHFGRGLSKIGNGLSNSQDILGSFSTGVLAVLIASPCTGPMMAPAISFALTQSLLTNILVFASLGLGMALPFLLLSHSPSLARILPKPGPWMVTFRQLLAFPMYISAAWLLFVFSNQTGSSAAFYLIIGAIGLAFALWLYTKQPTSRWGQWLTKSTALVAICLALLIGFNGERIADRHIEPQPYSQQLVEKIRRAGHPVFVDITADWCITCKANKLNALSRLSFKKTLRRHGYVMLKGDYTNEDPEITKVLRKYNRAGVPLYLVYPADPKLPVEVLPQILTKELVINALNRNAR